MFQYHNLGRGKKTIKVQAMAQDPARNLYVGTDAGLFKYNGIEFQRRDATGDTGIASVTALAFQGAVLWVGGLQGELNRLRNDTVYRFTHPRYTIASRITGFAVDDKGSLYVATYGDGIYVVQGDSMRHLTAEQGLSDDFVYTITAHAGFLWAGTDAGITRITPGTDEMLQLSMKDGLPDNIVRSMTPAGDSALYIGMYDLGICKLNTATMKFEPLPGQPEVWEHGAVDALVLDNRGTLWAGTKDLGLVCIKTGTRPGNIRVFSEVNGLGSNRILSLLQDAEQNLWIATHKGLSLYSGSTFEYLTRDDGLLGENIYDFLVDRNGNYWICSDKGVVKFSYSASGEGLLQTYLENDGTLNRQIVSIYEDHTGMIWMGSYGNGLYRLNTATGEMKNFGRANGLENTNIMDIVQDPAGNLWLATLGGGVARVSFTNGGEHIEHIRGNELMSMYVYALMFDREGDLWIGTDGAGVACYDDVHKTFKSNFGDELASTTVYAMCEDSEGHKWFATADHGLFRYSRGAWANYNESHGLRSNGVVALTSSSSGDLIAIHSMGIDVLKQGENHFTEYNTDKEGFNFEPNLNACFNDHDNIWIGTESGVVKFSFGTTGLDQQTPAVTLTGLRVLYEPRSFRDTEFDYGENHFVFDYLGIWMRSPSDIRYKYILEGFDKQWSFETESRNATYSNLPPGNYTFRVITTNGNGAWSDETEATYSFVILKPFWMKWWFYVLLALAVIASVALFIHVRTRRLREEKKRLEDEVVKRTEEIRYQKDVIQEKNKEIVDSINYARRIQSAILPPDRLMKDHLPGSFVLYKPKDIVAGDFYWMETVGETVLFAAADCTGHGVPGAMVSVVCHNALNRAVREFGLTEPARILDVVLKLVIEQFSKSEEDVKDGMDIALCAYHTETRELQYSGAQNPLWIVSPNAQKVKGDKEPHSIRPGVYLHEVKPDKQPIGKYAEPRPFTNHTLSLEPGEVIYIFSDGYADQFGGPRGKKFKYSTLKELLLSIQDRSMEQQRVILEQRFREWQGELEQVDDVCIIGVRV